MTSLFSYFTGKYAPFYLPGAPFLMGALLTLISIGFVVHSFISHPSQNIISNISGKSKTDVNNDSKSEIFESIA